jgi:hypothetical protein
MANNYTKTMRQALQEAREYRDTTEGGPGSGPQKGGKKFSSSEIKKAYGILNDPRYKQGNYTGAAKAINKLAPGLADHPDVKNAMKRANENLDLPATGDTTTSNASQESVNEFKLKDSDVEKLKQGVKQMPPMKGAKLGKPEKVKTADEEYVEEAMKKEMAKKARAARIETKEVKFKPNIGEHDLLIKLKHAQEFLDNGAKVKITIQMRGRENANRDEVFKHFKEAIDSYLKNFKYDSNLTLNGNRIIGVLFKDG